MSRRLWFQWKRHGTVIVSSESGAVAEPGARDLRQVGGWLEYEHYRVRFDERASMYPWIVEWRGAVGTQAVGETWFHANARPVFREARAIARSLNRHAIERLSARTRAESGGER